jgi:hypothetical protein
MKRQTTIAGPLAILFCGIVSLLWSSETSADDDWPELPTRNAKVSIPAQEWPQKPGPRVVDISIHYPDGTIGSVTKSTGRRANSKRSRNWSRICKLRVWTSSRISSRRTISTARCLPAADTLWATAPKLCFGSPANISKRDILRHLEHAAARQISNDVTRW